MSKVHRFRAAIGTLCVGLLLLMLSGSIAVAQLSGPTLAKCTCHFDEKDPPATDGAQAVNATLCVQMMDKSHKWCEITVACLRGNIGPQCGASSAPQTALLPLYAFAVAQITQTGGPPLNLMKPTFGENEETVSNLSKENSAAIENCVKSYLSRSKEDRQITADRFDCAYDRTTGWLAIAFIAGPDLIQFSFGPRE
jgi:hypothetical protein